MSHLEDAMKQPAFPPGPHYVGNSQVGCSDLVFPNHQIKFFQASACCAQVTCGVLLKYVNFGKGWRHRVFVLKDGVFRYYKVCSQCNVRKRLNAAQAIDSFSTHLQIFGMHGINLPTLLDSLRKEGEVVTIGTETGVLESKRCVLLLPFLGSQHCHLLTAFYVMQNKQRLLQDAQR